MKRAEGSGCEERCRFRPFGQPNLVVPHVELVLLLYGSPNAGLHTLPEPPSVDCCIVDVWYEHTFCVQWQAM